MSPTSQELRTYRDRLRDLVDAEESALLDEAPQKKRKPFNPRRLLALTFLILIGIGTFLLCTPWAQASGRWAWQPTSGPFTWSFAIDALLDALFMATSASCVTGLTVVDVSTTYTTFGHAILLGCVQLGGLSLLTLGTVLVTLLLGRVTTGGEEQMMVSYGANSSSNAKRLLGQTMRYVLTFELLGAVLLFSRYFWAYGYPLGKSVWYAIFHAVTAFCNAGMSLHQNNLAPFQNDIPYLTIITTLVILGGIGFLVLANVFHYHFWRRDLRKRGRISLHSRIVLWTTLLLCVGGGLLFTLLEWHGVLGEIPGPTLKECLLNGDIGTFFYQLIAHLEKLWTGFSQAIVTRTAGYNFVPMSEVSQGANTLSIFLMIIGGSPGSLAGGIKTTTLVILLLTIRAYVRGNPSVQIHRRTISDAICREAMVIIFFYFMTLFLFYFTLRLTEDALIAARGDFALFYEVTSAIGTVGSSLDATPLLTSTGKAILAFAMFLGRLGPISIAFIMAGRGVSQRIRYPEENITVG